MLFSKAFIPTLREAPQEAECISHRLMLRAGLVRQLMSGVYMYLPLGLRVLNNIQNIIREEMNKIGAQELLLPALQPLDIWQISGRDKDIGEVMFRFVDRKGKNLCLGPTHEEVITVLVKENTYSYKQLPLILYQIQTKFRDELRPRFGMLRACEFIMKDAYSFDMSEDGLRENYNHMYKAYSKIFRRCGLDFLVLEADPGVMGGSVSHEFMVPAESGEDLVLYCSNCKYAESLKEEKKECPKCNQELEKITCIEVGHIFQLGTKYSVSFNLKFQDKDGLVKPVIMGCYGIGVSRLISAIIEQHYDQDGIIWPREISPYEGIILALDTENREIIKLAREIYDKITKLGISVILDDRLEPAGVKFKDADLLGLSFQIIIGKEFIKNKKIELKIRDKKQKMMLNKSEILTKIKGLFNEKRG